MKKLIILLLSSILAGLLFHYSFRVWYSSLSQPERSGQVANELINDIGLALLYLFISHLIYWLLNYSLLKKAGMPAKILVGVVIGTLVRILFMVISLGIDFTYTMNTVEVIGIAIFTGIVPILDRFYSSNLSTKELKK